MPVFTRLLRALPCAIALVSSAQSASSTAQSGLAYATEQEEPLVVGRLDDVDRAFGTIWNNPPVTNSMLDDFSAAGIKWYRHQIDWGKIESPDGKYRPMSMPGDTDISATFYQALKARNMKAYGLLLGGNTNYGPFDETTGLPKYDPSKPEVNFLSPARFADFCGAMVTRYGNSVSYWQLGNEPHNYLFGAYFGNDADENGRVKWGPHYAAYFNAGATRIKSLQPGAKIITTGEDNTGFQALKENFATIAANVDVVAFHPYVDKGSPYPEGMYPHLIKPFLEMAKAYKVPDVWVTEIGWQTPGGALDPTVSEASLTSPLGQAKYLARSRFFYPIRCKAKVVSQFSWEGSGNSFALRDPGMLMFKRLNAILKDPAPDADLAPFRNASARIAFRTRPDGMLAAQVEKYLLVKSGKKLFLVLWLMVTQDDAALKKRIDLALTLPGGLSVASVCSHDVILGGQDPVGYAVKGKVLTLSDTWISDYPNLIEINLQ